MSSYILDLVIGKGNLMIPMNSASPMWFVISADGLQHPFSTPSVNASEKPEWNHKVRLILNIEDLSRAYIYFTLCTYSPNGRDVIAIGRSRVGLRNLPKGHPKQFMFPLMSPSNSAQEAMRINVIASFSQFSQQRNVNSNHPNAPMGSLNNMYQEQNFYSRP
ncbi:hypothetical protein TRFO_16126 [Tritrichomonas foetus]|uniref:C2 domain-containing protein n=1 Tax=Tritrichomonas foetus TaxID=1144522 RepID=A0A1J4KQY3_9EUKA|nr:hypothetical protein TRFO_16126 [Tritrichomonas foetus]|eukprot:OHT13689.1 hypothetical protein TRFO_16126 [Tritrichomonas foetus]